MPRIVSDIVDVYVFRRLNARVQFLLLHRKAEASMGNTWQAFHSQIQLGDTTLQTVTRVVEESIDLKVDEVYSADYINQFYDEARDAMVLSPVFAVTLEAQSPVRLSPEYRDAAWFDRDDATARLPFSGQRWAVRHIDEIMGASEEQRAIYRLDTSIWQPSQGLIDTVPTLAEQPASDDEESDLSTQIVDNVASDED